MSSARAFTRNLPSPSPFYQTVRCILRGSFLIPLEFPLAPIPHAQGGLLRNQQESFLLNQTKQNVNTYNYFRSDSLNLLLTGSF
jgi:hypothetical protein